IHALTEAAFRTAPAAGAFFAPHAQLDIKSCIVCMNLPPCGNTVPGRFHKIDTPVGSPGRNPPPHGKPPPPRAAAD
ncbi:MAG: hypothetical protein J0H52_21015, partial [Comamonadaceae bacterium]|nr:hypothetical protein [Comamonadaceae bacterium]